MKSTPKPPKWADQFLQWFVDENLLEEIQGDLHEAYYHRTKTEGLTKARWLFWEDVFRFFRPYAFEKYSNVKQFLPMYHNYFKIAFRNILHRKQFTAINLLGLSIGISAVLLIGLYLQNEWTYDQSTPDHERIHRVGMHFRDQLYAPMPFENYQQTDAADQVRMVNYLRELDAVESAACIAPSASGVNGMDQVFIRVNDKEFIQNKFHITSTGKDFLDIFPQDFLMGNQEAAFLDYHQVLVTESMAERYFGTNWQQQNILGQPFRFEHHDSLDYEIVGVIANPPNNVHYDLDVVVHVERLPSWGAYTYIKTKPNASIAAIRETAEKDVDVFLPGFSENELFKGLNTVALTDIHFTKEHLYELKPSANEAYLKIFGLIAFVILLIIWTNYTNLSIAMYADRQKELGMRKVMGARGQDISFQLMIEAILLTLLCLPIVWAILQTSLPYANTFLGWELNSGLLYSSATILTLLGILVFTGLFSGLYPAIVYGQKSMVNLFGATLTGKPGKRLFNFRNSLVTIQFTLLIGLLSVTWFIHQQMDYISQKDLGFEKEGLVFFNMAGGDDYEQLKTSLEQLPEIEAVGAGMRPGREMYNQLTYKLKGTDHIFSDATTAYPDPDMFKTLGLECKACEIVKAGKERILVINQTAAKQIAQVNNLLPEQLIGQTIILEPEAENDENGFGYPHVIEEIINDYTYFSLKYAASPLFMHVFQRPNWGTEMVIKANTSNWPQTINKIEAAYKEVDQVQPFSIQFLDKHIESLYESEQQAGYFMTGLSLVAIILALMGLAGIVSYIAFNRQKEIGIRKVFGASQRDILWIMNKDFVLLMFIAMLIATPFALYLTKQWLTNFAFSISVNPLIVVLSGLIALGLVLLVVTWQSRKAMEKNPIDTLKYY